jgi:uncharacterized protein (TIGR02145 family)
MKKSILNVILMLLVSFSIAQETRLNFSSGNAGETIDSIIVLNQSSGQRLKLSGSETLILKNIPTNIPVMSMPDENGFLYPNPSGDFALMNYVTNKEGRMELKLFNASGHLLGSFTSYLTQGMHQFRVTFPAHGFYIISVMQGHGIKNYKAISLERKKQDFRVEYLGEANNTLEYGLSTKSHPGQQLMDYWEGDILQFTFYSGENITVMTSSPNTTKEMVVDFYKCTDQDNRNYKTVKIGDQVWMAENLAYLPSVSLSTVGSETKPYYYVYGYDGSDLTTARQNANYMTYGVLYNWPAAITACPAGWHLPGNDEWNQLEMKLGMTQEMIDRYGWRGTEQGNKIKNSFGWSSNGNGSNEVGFCALPGGYRDPDQFRGVGYGTYWWSSTEYNNSIAWERSIAHDRGAVWRNGGGKLMGFSVRCVMDK